MLTTEKYNKTIHTVTNRKPTDVFHNASAEIRVEIKEKIMKAQLDRDNP